MSYRLKLTVTVALLIAIAFGIGGTLMITTSFRVSLEAETSAALEQFEEIQNTLYLLNYLTTQSNRSSLSKVLMQMADHNMRSWQALTLKENGRILFQDGSGIPEHHSLPAPPEGQCCHVPITDEYGCGLLVLGFLSINGSELELLCRFDLSPVYSARQTQLRIYRILFLLVVLFAIASAVMLSATLTRPLRKLTTTAKAIAEGDLSKRSGISTVDEFGQLSRAFDSMARKLQDTIGQLNTDMERQEQFMGAFAHELKTPMTSIIGFADLLRQGDLDENTRMRAADYIYSEGRRLERLSFKLLELLLLKRDSLQMRRVSLSSFLHEVEHAMAPTLRKKGIRFVCKSAPGTAFFEPDLVKSLLYNLIDNASKAMDNGGIIGVTAAATGRGCQFLVADNGRGMEQEELIRITEAFYRVDKARSRSQGGAGLGLALCRQIVELHSGTLHFASTPGKGTRVTVILKNREVSKDG